MQTEAIDNKYCHTYICCCWLCLEFRYSSGAREWRYQCHQYMPSTRSWYYRNMCMVAGRRMLIWMGLGGRGGGKQCRSLIFQMEPEMSGAARNSMPKSHSEPEMSFEARNVIRSPKRKLKPNQFDFQQRYSTKCHSKPEISFVARTVTWSPPKPRSLHLPYSHIVWTYPNSLSKYLNPSTHPHHTVYYYCKCARFCCHRHEDTKTQCRRTQTHKQQWPIRII